MQGCLLIANPLLNDGFFNRSVIQLITHETEGSVGFTLNFKTKLSLSDVKPELKMGTYPIYEGGPVARNQLFYMHKLGDKVSDSFHVKGDIFFGGDFDSLVGLIEQGQVSGSDVRFFSGYSGWGELQLMTEMQNGHWFRHDPDDTGFFSTPPEDLWKEQLKQVKWSYGIFADFGFDPSMN